MNLKKKILEGFKKATAHNSSVMSPPEVILWTDPDKQWEPVVERLQESYRALFVLGAYRPEKRIGPAVWLKTVIGGMLTEPVWDKQLTPVIYLPGISKIRLKEVATIGLDLQPLVEYQYNGTYFNQHNGKDWTVMAMLMNPDDGLGLNMKQDNATKEAVVKALTVFFEMDRTVFSSPVIDAEFINNLVFPDAISYILKWMRTGDAFLSGMEASLRDTFTDICKSRYGFEPDYKNIKEIALKLGKQENAWKHIWNFYANSPTKYLQIEQLLREAKPADLGSGMFKIPDESWPQVNEEREEALRAELGKLSRKDATLILAGLQKLEAGHKERTNWVWTELGYSPLVKALDYLVKLSVQVNAPYPSGSLDEVIQFYTQSGFYTDTCMRKAYASVKTEKDKAVVRDLIQLIYKPWLQKLTEKFQNLVMNNLAAIGNYQTPGEPQQFYLFVDAFRFEMAKEYIALIEKRGFEVELSHSFTALPTLTSTAKPKCSPVADEISAESEIQDFTPQFKSGKQAIITYFRAELEKKGYTHNVKKGFASDKSYWVEIGNIDTFGHDEQSEMLKRTDELFAEINEVIDAAAENGIKKIKIVTDHGWLMLPGGLPSARMVKDLTVARCGRCALIKEGVSTDLMQLPWEWNPSTFITYAPGISFFRNNEAYAHGGISLQECIVPEIVIHIHQQETISAKIVSHRWVNLRCNIETESTPDGYKLDIRTKFNDEKTSVVISANQTIADNKSSLMVDDGFVDSAAFIVLTDERGKIIDKVNTSIGN